MKYSAITLAICLLITVQSSKLSLKDIKSSNYTARTSDLPKSQNYTFDPVQCAVGIKHHEKIIKAYSQGKKNHTILVELFGPFVTAMRDIAYGCSMDEHNITWLNLDVNSIKKEHLSKAIKTHDAQKKKLFSIGHAYDTGSTIYSDIESIADDADGGLQIPTWQGENKWLKTGSDLVNLGIAAGEIMADPLDPFAWIEGAIDAVKVVGDVVDDFGKAIGNFFDSLFGGDDEEEQQEDMNELNHALESQELENMQAEASENAENSSPFESNQELNEGLKNLENEVKNALEQSEDEQSFMDTVDTKSASIDFLLDMLFT